MSGFSSVAKLEAPNPVWPRRAPHKLPDGWTHGEWAKYSAANEALYHSMSSGPNCYPPPAPPPSGISDHHHHRLCCPPTRTVRQTHYTYAHCDLRLTLLLIQTASLRSLRPFSLHIPPHACPFSLARSEHSPPAEHSLCSPPTEPTQSKLPPCSARLLEHISTVVNGLAIAMYAPDRPSSQLRLQLRAVQRDKGLKAHGSAKSSANNRG